MQQSFQPGLMRDYEKHLTYVHVGLGQAESIQRFLLNHTAIRIVNIFMFVCTCVSRRWFVYL